MGRGKGQAGGAICFNINAHEAFTSAKQASWVGGYNIGYALVVGWLGFVCVCVCLEGCHLNAS